MGLIRLVLQGHVPRGCLGRVYLAFSGYLQKCSELMILRITNLFGVGFFFFLNRIEIYQTCFTAVSCFL